MKKSATIYMDDPMAGKIPLVITGKVNSFANISPRYARLNGLVGQKIKTEVNIFPIKEYPFKITSHNTRTGKNIQYNLINTTKDGKKGYKVVIKNIKEGKGRYSDTIYLHTDNKLQPRIKIGVYGYIVDPPKKQIVSDKKNQPDKKNQTDKKKSD